MASAPRLPRASASSSTFIRLLTQLSGAGPAESRQTFAEQLSPWLDWTDAISLSAALAGAPTADRPGASTTTGTPTRNGTTSTGTFTASAMREGCARVRADLTRSITTEGACPADADVTAFAGYRRQYQSQQRTMADRIGPLRSTVRSALSKHSAALGRLAALDAAFDAALAERERHLLAKVPALLEQRFERLRRAQQDTPANAADPWWAAYGRDMQNVLLAELDVRLQPIDGMVAALGQPNTGQP